ncbi:MAG: mandelate racemase/muconate lactonizing enzyme family protein [Cyclobacteriaceae bacterium]|nr:mandelate racemase/muconate lactonizing enzyme family protein [Cyclobacteriaceae bacterium HetDA_MAG_MS6]
MKNRRSFLKKTAGATLIAPLAACSYEGADKSTSNGYTPSDRLKQFRKIAASPVLQKEKVKQSIIIESINIYQNGKHFFLKAVSTDGAVGICSGNGKYIKNIYPIILNRIIPHFEGKDARDLEMLIENTYMGMLNYKWQGLAFWVGVAYVEIAILDLLGRVSSQPIGELLGGRVREQVGIYYASGKRGNPAEEEVEHLQGLVEKSGAKAVKYRLGARMRYDSASTKRDKELIPLVRKTLGDDATIYTDANGSYDVAMGIHIGKILEEYATDFYEEPCPFDHYEETVAVSKGLNIPIAGGEEEVSTRQFMWLMDQGIYDIVQPDLLFYGGLTRSIKIARMAQSIGIKCTPHISGKALGFLYMAQFASCVRNIGPYQEFKGNSDKVPVESLSSSLQPQNGLIDIPKEPGLGVEFDPEFIAKGKLIRSI